MAIESVPAGWEVWSEESTKLILVYRPDVFDSTAFPAPCLPTLYVTKGRRSRRPGRAETAPDDLWIVRLYLEPDVVGPVRECDDREAAMDQALDLAGSFTAGDFDYRALYQQPRTDYLDRLDALTGRET